METLPAQHAKAATTKAKAMAAAAPELRLPPPHRFTPLELAAAEQLIHLSESSSSAAPASAASSASSPCSVNAPTPPPHDAPAPAPAAADDDEEEAPGRQRRGKRYRTIAEIYAATRPIGGRAQRNKRGVEERRQ